MLAFFFAFNNFDADVLAYEDGNEQDITIETDTTKEADMSSDEEKSDTTDDEIVESEEDDEESDEEDVKSGEEDVKSGKEDAKSEEESEAASKAADDIDNLVEEPVNPEEIENKGEGEIETEFPEFSYQESVDGYTISIDAPEGVFPEGTTTKISVVNDPISLIEGEVDEERDIQYIITFDISFWHDGTEIEPQNEKVNVSISLTPEIKENLQDDTAQLQVFHIENETDIEEIAATTDDEEICFEADSFSPYSFVVTTAANTPNKYYTVYFKDNGVDYVYGSMGSIRCEFGKEYQLPKSTLTQDVYKFIGWNTMPDGTGTYYGDEAMIIDLTTIDYGYVNLYAQWEVDYSNCPHSGRAGGEWVEINNVVTKEASSTEWGEVQRKCSFCGAAVETISVHPYDTYEIALQDGTVQKVCGWFDSDYSREVYEQVNEYRLENGLNTLVYNSSLEYASDLRALECSVYFQHTRPNGTRWNTVTSGWQSGAGENIASGYDTPSKVMQGWKNSPGHNANMLYGINSG
ncbi:MAG: InlB B-repeat-containing protein, partial [Butyrivibrio sp.]|nr:InlB B-repeat-containing protein [Butyrivibrio sp.]